MLTDNGPIWMPKNGHHPVAGKCWKCEAMFCAACGFINCPFCQRPINADGSRPGRKQEDAGRGR
jgi:hypothetical protein